MTATESVHWFRRAEEPPVVLLHGFTGAVASWEAVAERVGARAVVALHLPGHHPLAPVASGWDANIDAIAATLAAHGVQECRVVGYSLGARAALGLAARHPARVRDALLIGAHPGLESEAARAERRAADARWSALLREDGIEAFVERWEAQPIFATQSAAARARQRSIRLAHDPLGLAASLEHMGLGRMPDYRAEARALGARLRVAVGERDARFAALTTELVEAPIRIPGCGHNPLVERPEAVAAII